MRQDENTPLSSAQIRAARALLRWSAEDLSRESSVSLRTIQRAELANGQTSLTFANNLAVRRALESTGVEFTNGDQPGVRLAKAAAARSAESPRALDQAVAVKVIGGKSDKASKKKR
jgi:hypothetical protein